MIPPSGLPVEEVVDEVRAALAGAGRAVLVAPPGAGKSTVLPLRLAGEPWLAGRRIVVLEPRRLAARAVATRMATLLGEPVGGTVGYVTRDERRTSPGTRVEVVTEGVLTRRLQSDPALPGTGLVVFDEQHERNLQTDVGLALLLDARRGGRNDARILVMSATLDVARLSEVLAGDDGTPVPLVTSAGRAHPVDVRWAPGRPKERVEVSTAAAVVRALREEEGDVLAFLPGAGEIARVERALTDRALGAVDLRPLHGSLPLADQDVALAPSPAGRRRVVLATDIAETSLTVEGVRVVVDAGLARRPRHDVATGMTRLVTVSCSKASADQRAGRAGRTGPGVAYRVWSKVEHAARRPHLAPEIAEADLAGLVLELAEWGRTAEELTWLDPPPARALEEGRALLVGLGALDERGRLTPTGRAMSALPLHPRLARMVVDAPAVGQGWLACVLAALLEDRDVLRGRPGEVTVDLSVRVGLVDDPGGRHPSADGRAVGRARGRARDVARRAGIEPGSLDRDRSGRVLALAYPDRLALPRGGRGRFALRGGTSALVEEGDGLAGAAALVAADLDGRRADARIRLAAALDPLDLLDAFGAEIVERRQLVWDRGRGDLVVRTEQRLGELSLGTVEQRPEPGPETTAALLDRVRSTRLAALSLDGAASLRRRVAYLRSLDPDGWPDWGDKALLAGLEVWLAPALTGAAGRADLEALDVGAALAATLDAGQHRTLRERAPREVVLAGGRRLGVDYSGGRPVARVRVQQLFGVVEHPRLGPDGPPLALELLSPADRPLQVTSDLPGFWAGSWAEVRKAMAGRYPKHAWPEDPVRARPPSGR